MRKCSSDCSPCCDFCIHAYHEWFENEAKNGDWYWERGGPIGCIIHYDERHQLIAESCGWCEDFYCFRQYERDKGVANEL